MRFCGHGWHRGLIDLLYAPMVAAPCHPVVMLAIGAGKGSSVLNLFGLGPPGLGVVGYMAADGAGFEGADVFPA